MHACIRCRQHLRFAHTATHHCVLRHAAATSTAAVPCKCIHMHTHTAPNHPAGTARALRVCMACMCIGRSHHVRTWVLAAMSSVVSSSPGLVVCTAGSMPSSASTLASLGVCSMAADWRVRVCCGQRTCAVACRERRGDGRGSCTHHELHAPPSALRRTPAQLPTCAVSLACAQHDAHSTSATSARMAAAERIMVCVALRAETFVARGFGRNSSRLA